MAILTFPIFVAIYMWIINIIIAFPLMWIVGAESGGWVVGLYIGIALGIVLAFKTVKNIFFKN